MNEDAPDDRRHDESTTNSQGTTGSNGGNAAGQVLTRLDIAELACKIIAVWILATVARNLSTILFFVFHTVFKGNREGISEISLGMIIPIAEMLVGICLWTNSKRIGSRMVSGKAAPIVTTEIGREDVLTMAFSVVGIYVLWVSVDQILTLVGTAIQVSRQQDVNVAQILSEFQWQSRLCAQLLSLALALWLLIGSRGIVRTIGRIRGDVQSPESDTRATVEEEK